MNKYILKTANIFFVLIVVSGIACSRDVRPKQSREISAEASGNDSPLKALESSSTPQNSMVPKAVTQKSDTQTRPAEVSDKKIIVYYFHRTLRCPSCLAIEEYARETVRKDFADALQKGWLEWREVNIDLAGNEHFEDDFKLEHQSVVLVEIADNKTKRWKNLAKVWALLNDQEAFQDYISKEVSEFIGR